jgi:hypothetical protein
VTRCGERPLLHVCHARSDEGWVHGERRSRLGLARNRARTPFDHELGQPKVRELERGLEECRIPVVVISPVSCRDHAHRARGPWTGGDDEP